MTSFAADAVLVAELIAAVLVLRTYRRHTRRAPHAFAAALEAIAAETEPAPRPARLPAPPRRAR